MRGITRTAALVLLAAVPAGAHSFSFTDVRLTLLSDGAFQVDVVADLDALALGVEPSADSAALAAEIQALPAPKQDELVAGLVDVLRRRLRVRFDEEPAAFDITLPERGLRPPGVSVPSALGLVARLQGRVPAGARTVSFFASRAFPPVRLTLVGADGKERPVEVVAPGAGSTPAHLAAAGPPPSRLETALRFVQLGFTHILPHGLDHVLFVLGLALLSPAWKPLLAQVSAFTLAHTLTLGLAVHGVVALPSRIVEPLIAASIVYVGVENLVRREASYARIAVVFAFGLLHGLGFAGALSEIGWPAGRTLVALLAFNVGVELGQLAVIVLALVALAAFTRLNVPRRGMEQVLSGAIAIVAFVWTVERVLW